MEIDLNNPTSFACDILAKGIIAESVTSGQPLEKVISNRLHNILDHTWIDDKMRDNIIENVATAMDIDIIE